jgi:hypothetical protein
MLCRERVRQPVRLLVASMLGHPQPPRLVHSTHPSRRESLLSLVDEHLRVDSNGPPSRGIRARVSPSVSSLASNNRVRAQARRWELAALNVTIWAVSPTVAFSRIQKPVPLLLTSLGVPTRASRHRSALAACRSTSVRWSSPRSSTGCSVSSTGEPTRVLTKVNFDHVRPRKQAGEGFRGSGRDW